MNALPSNDFLVSLNIEITPDLINEGISRDIVRAIQQNRKDANLQITDHIELTIFSTNPQILAVAKNYNDYIKSQVLAKNIIINQNNINSSQQNNLTNLKIFDNQLDDGDIQIALRVL